MAGSTLAVITRTRVSACPAGTNYDGPAWPWLLGTNPPPTERHQMVDLELADELAAAAREYRQAKHGLDNALYEAAYRQRELDTTQAAVETLTAKTTQLSEKLLTIAKKAATK